MLLCRGFQTVFTDCILGKRGQRGQWGPIGPLMYTHVCETGGSIFAKTIWKSYSINIKNNMMSIGQRNRLDEE